MGGWVISPFISEEHVRILHKENMLRDFAKCSKTVVVDNIIRYLGTADADPEVKKLLQDVYRDKLAFLAIQQDEEVNASVEKVYGYTFESVHAGLSIAELQEMRDTILHVYNDQCSVPYINTISSDLIAGIINNLMALHRVNHNPEYKRLSYILTKNKDLFRDKPNAVARGTIFKSITKRSQDLDVILRGIDFLIAQKTAGKSPESWRFY